MIDWFRCNAIENFIGTNRHFRRSDGRFSDTASVVSNAVLNHYASYHRRPVNRVRIELSTFQVAHHHLIEALIHWFCLVIEFESIIGNIVPRKRVGLSQFGGSWTCSSMSHRWTGGRMTKNESLKFHLSRLKRFYRRFTSNFYTKNVKMKWNYYFKKEKQINNINWQYFYSLVTS